MRVASLLLVFLLFRVPEAASAPVPPPASPTDIATRFYGWVIEHDRGGFPPESSLVAGTDLMSERMTRLLRAAAATERRCVQSTPPDLKAPIFEGSLFVDNYEGVTKVRSMRWRKTGERALVSARLEYQGASVASDIAVWTDRLVLAREKGRWVVADVGGPEREKTLVATLKNYIRADCRA